MEITVVLNNFQNPHSFVTAFLISVKNDLYNILFVAMVTKFNNLSGFYDFVAMETTGGGTKWQKDTKWYNYTT